jgi:PilZ domain
VAPKREQRTIRRIEPLAAPCRIRQRGRQIPGHLVDLSARGARVAAEENLPKVGSRVVIEARFGALPATRLPGHVKWVKAAPKEAAGGTCGVSFRGLTGEQQLALEFVLYEFKRRAAQLG